MKVWIYIYFPVFRNFNCRQNSYSVGLNLRPVFIRKLVSDSRPIKSNSRLKRSWIFIRASFFCNFVVWSIAWAADTLCRRRFVRLRFELVLNLFTYDTTWGHFGSNWGQATKSMSSLGFQGARMWPPYILIFVIFNFFSNILYITL